MAQLVARFHGMEEVRGSNPLSSTKIEFLIFTRFMHSVTIVAMSTAESSIPRNER